MIPLSPLPLLYLFLAGSAPGAGSPRGCRSPRAGRRQWVTDVTQEGRESWRARLAALPHPGCWAAQRQVQLQTARRTELKSRSAPILQPVFLPEDTAQHLQWVTAPGKRHLSSENEDVYLALRRRGP